MSIFPTDLLEETRWAFIGNKYESISEFNDEVKQYQIDIRDKDIWDPNTIIINVSKIKIFYEVWESTADEDDNIDDVRREIVLDSDNKQYFTKGELLFKLHNAVVEDIGETTHIFFQGLSIADDTDKLPLYFMSLGS